MKKSLKRMSVLALVLCLAAAMSVTAFATGYDKTTNPMTENSETRNGGAGIPEDAVGHEKEITVNITATDGGTIHVIALNYDKTTLELAFTKPDLIWDPVTLQYVEQNPKPDVTWTAQEDTITVTNFSDIDMTLTASITNSTRYDSTELTPTASGKMAAATPGAAGGTSSVTVKALGTYQPTATATDTLTITATKTATP